VFVRNDRSLPGVMRRNPADHYCLQRQLTIPQMGL